MTLQQKVEMICQEYAWNDLVGDSQKVAKRIVEIVENDNKKVWQEDKAETAMGILDYLIDIIGKNDRKALNRVKLSVILQLMKAKYLSGEDKTTEGRSK